MLYAQVLPFDTRYWEKQGWRRLVPEGESKAPPTQIVAMTKAIGPGKSGPSEAPQAVILRWSRKATRATACSVNQYQ